MDRGGDSRISSDMKKPSSEGNIKESAEKKSKKEDDEDAMLNSTSSGRGMLERLLMRCPVCEQSYGNDLVARNLICGHSLCTDCANQCLFTEKLCPECNEKQTVTLATDLVVNYPLMRLVRSVIDKEIDLENIKVPEFAMHVPILAGFEDAGDCPAHKSPLVYLCLSCSIWVCQDCLVIDHPYFPRGTCKITNMPMAMDLLKKECQKCRDICLNNLELVQENFETLKMKAKLFTQYGHCPSDIRSHGRLLQEIEESFEKLRNDDEAAVQALTIELSRWGELANETVNPREMSECGQNLLTCHEKVKRYNKREQERHLPVVRSILTHFRMDLKQLVMGKEAAYAVREKSDKTMYSLISLKEDRLLLYSLREELPPTNSVTIPYDLVKELIPRRDVTIFFEVGTSETLMGRVYVMLFGGNNRAKQTVLLCSGEAGPCYRNTCFYEYDDAEGVLKGGDYENNDGTGGAPIERLGENNTGFDFRPEKGLLVSIADSSKFQFYLKNVRKTVKNAIGNVSKGLDFLLMASKIDPVKNVMIKDCGLFISMNMNSESNSNSEIPPFLLNMPTGIIF